MLAREPTETCWRSRETLECGSEGPTSATEILLGRLWLNPTSGFCWRRLQLGKSIGRALGGTAAHRQIPKLRSKPPARERLEITNFV